MITFAVWNKDYMGLLYLRSDRTTFATAVKKRADATTAVPWSPIRGELMAYLEAGGIVSEPGTPLPPPPPAAPPPLPTPSEAQNKSIEGSAAAREARIVKRLAKRDPVEALLRQGGLK